MILIPARDEDGSNVQVIMDTRRHWGQVPIVVIDDGSRDEIRAAAAAAGAIA